MSELNIERDRYTNRRKMAWRSFWILVLVFLPITVLAVLDESVAKNVTTVQFLITTMVGAFVGIIGFYFGATTMTDRAEVYSSRQISYGASQDSFDQIGTHHAVYNPPASNGVEPASYHTPEVDGGRDDWSEDRTGYSGTEGRTWPSQTPAHRTTDV